MNADDTTDEKLAQIKDAMAGGAASPTENSMAPMLKDKLMGGMPKTQEALGQLGAGMPYSGCSN